jgi:hypothetical protein
LARNGLSSSTVLQKYVIVCNDEPNTPEISNERAFFVWIALDDLLLILLKDSAFASQTTLFAWKKESPHFAGAKEPYTWRAAIDEIKNSDLASRCESLRGDPERFVLLTDKPVMLKIAGEIATSLLHSYSSRHGISFVPVQRASKVPS